MNILKTILIVIVVIVGIVLIAAIFVKNEYSITRSVVINKPKQQVYDYVKIQRNMEQYNKWWLADPASKIDYRGTDGTVGFIAAWDSEKLKSKGEQEIKSLTEGQSIDCEMRFERPFKNVSYTKMTTEAAGDNQTKVTWIFTGVRSYPSNVMNLAMDGLLGKDLQASLDNLKAMLEKQ